MMLEDIKHCPKCTAYMAVRDAGPAPDGVLWIYSECTMCGWFGYYREKPTPPGRYIIRLSNNSNLPPIVD